ncbi:DUF423 domain-containing protein [Alicyclobacillus tolerans]|uniref:DUF423 domain-containing protein n=1 Tax=Alicyclobacillus tolerans TaxID=90970 RepID=UPI001F239A42|nr:DUF423 domain-containing protein [Alicyclobacillus tolerans]MCF8564075.1 DUF423 domain-containing protein [Alicyclobacillus tolerans]
MSASLIALGAVFAFLSVALGAFGAHGLKQKVSAEELAVFQTGAQYQMYHSLGLILIGTLVDKFPNGHLAVWSGWLFVVGIVLFSGSLYLLTLTKKRALGAITPLGGLAFLAGWALLVVTVLGG